MVWYGKGRQICTLEVNSTFLREGFFLFLFQKVKWLHLKVHEALQIISFSIFYHINIYCFICGLFFVVLCDPVT